VTESNYKSTFVGSLYQYVTHVCDFRLENFMSESVFLLQNLNKLM
jgi:hypothetical protein